jgi:hypothetical protein
MTLIKALPALAASALLFASGAAFAADYSAPATTTTTKPATTQKSAAATKTTAPKTAESIECSKEADAKGLHGAVRKSFRSSCKAALKAGKPVPEPKKT